jgi:hypothetical protein
MKSTQTQYNELREGNMSQANFMRNIRMTFPQYITNVTNFDDSVKILKNKGLLSEAKAENTDHLCNPVEVDLGLKVEVAKHEGDVEKAKKTVYANLKKNSSYYSQLNLSGQAVEPEKIKVKKSKKKNSDIDTENGMKKVKDVVKENVDEKMYFADMPADPEKYKIVKDSKGYIIKATNADGVEFQKGDVVKTYDGEEIKIAKFEESQSKVKAIYSTGMFFKGIDIDGLEAPKETMRPGVDMGKSFEKFKASLEEIVREVLEEENQLNEGYYDDIAGYDSVSDNGTGFKDNDKVKSKSGQEGVVYDVLKSKEGKALVVVKFQNNGNTTISKYGEGFSDINDISK